MVNRNRGCVPHFQLEGEFLKPLVENPEIIHTNNPFERVNCHHTLASARRYAHFRPFKNLIPNDHLDFILNATYDHSNELFPDRVDLLLQPETRGERTWRRLQNTFDIKPSLKPRLLLPVFDNFQPKSQTIPFKYNKVHPVIIGGIKERIHPSYVKLMNSSHHLPQTNAGYTRQPSDGTVFQY